MSEIDDLKFEMGKLVHDYRNLIRSRPIKRKELSEERLGYLASRIGDYKKKVVTNYKGRSLTDPDASKARSICRAFVYLCPTAKQVNFASKILSHYDQSFAPGHVLFMKTNGVYERMPFEKLLMTCNSPQALVNYAVYGMPTPELVEILSKPFDETDYFTFLTESISCDCSQTGILGFSDDSFMELSMQGYLPPNIDSIYPYRMILKRTTRDMFSKMGMFRHFLDYENIMKAFQERVNRYDKLLAMYPDKPLSDEEKFLWSKPTFLKNYKSLYVKLIETVGPLSKRSVNADHILKDAIDIKYDIPEYKPTSIVRPTNDPLLVAAKTPLDAHPEELITNLEWKEI